MSVCTLSNWIKKEGHGEFYRDEPLSKYTTWKIGGLAELFYRPYDQEDFINVYQHALQERIPITILGGGSNLLIADEGLTGLVIHTKGLKEVKWFNNSVQANAGVLLSYLSRMACDRGFTGLEFAAGIPGTLGGAVIMNAGANAQTISEVVANVLVISPDGNIKRYENEELTFAYRTSNLKETKEVVLDVTLHLKRGDTQKIKKTMEEYIQFRKDKQPLHLPNAGSVFKNPPGDSAGRLIEAVGAKGWRIGDAEVSKLHANFIVNQGQAKASDVKQLIEEVRKAVLEKFNILLETEVILLGF